MLVLPSSSSVPLSSCISVCCLGRDSSSSSPRTRHRLGVLMHHLQFQGGQWSLSPSTPHLLSLQCRISSALHLIPPRMEFPILQKPSLFSLPSFPVPQTAQDTINTAQELWQGGIKQQEQEGSTRISGEI